MLRSGFEAWCTILFSTLRSAWLICTKLSRSPLTLARIAKVSAWTSCNSFPIEALAHPPRQRGARIGVVSQSNERTLQPSFALRPIAPLLASSIRRTGGSLFDQIGVKIHLCVNSQPQKGPSVVMRLTRRSAVAQGADPTSLSLRLAACP